MTLKPVIQISEIKDYQGFFPNLRNRYLLKLVKKILTGVSRFVGYPVAIIVPEEIGEFRGDHESLRALHLLSKLRTAGIVQSFYFEEHHYSDEPKTNVAFARLADIKRFGFSGKGAHLFDRAKTLWPAVGEAVERYATQFHYPKAGEYIDASWNELDVPKVDIFKVAGFDETLRAKKHARFRLSYDADTKFRWVKARELPEGREIWAPLQWFSFSHIQRYSHSESGLKYDELEPLLSIPITTGAATGQNETDATMRGLLEVIERDAFIIYWLNQLAAKRIDVTSFSEKRFSELQNIADDYNLDIHLLYLETDVPVHTVCSIVIDRSGIGPALIIGAKSGLSLSDTAFDAFGETLAQRGLYRKMVDMNRGREISFDDISTINHVERMLYWFDVNRLKEIEHFISGELVSADTLPKYSYTDDLNTDLAKLLLFFTEKNYQVFSRELLNDKLKDITEGLSVMMVRVPQMQPLYLEESLRGIEGERLRSVPELLGYPASAKKGDYFSIVPHPFP